MRIATELRIATGCLPIATNGWLPLLMALAIGKQYHYIRMQHQLMQIKPLA